MPGNRCANRLNGYVLLANTERFEWRLRFILSLRRRDDDCAVVL